MTKFDLYEIRDREEFLLLLEERLGSLGGHPSLIARSLPAGTGGSIDLLCAERSGRLVAVDFSLELDDVLLLRGLLHHSWITDNCEAIASLCADHPIRPDLPPALHLIAPDFPDGVMQATTLLRSIPIQVFRFRCLLSDGEKGLLLESVKKSGAPSEAPDTDIRPFRTGLTDEEIQSLL